MHAYEKQSYLNWSLYPWQHIKALKTANINIYVVENGFLSSVTWSILYSWKKSGGVYFFKFSFNFRPNESKLKSGGLNSIEPIWFQFGLIWTKIEGELEKITPPYFFQDYKIDRVT